MSKTVDSETLLDFLYRSIQELAVVIYVADDLQTRLGIADGDVASGMSYILSDIRDRMRDQITAAEAPASTRRAG